jgi:hypothetical protein
MASDGVFEFDGFYGSYSYQLSAEDGKVLEVYMSIGSCL